MYEPFIATYKKAAAVRRIEVVFDCVLIDRLVAWPKRSPPLAVTCTAAAEEEDGSLRLLRAPSAARVLRKIRYRFI